MVGLSGFLCMYPAVVVLVGCGRCGGRSVCSGWLCGRWCGRSGRCGCCARPSQHTINASARPRFLSSVSIAAHWVTPSPPDGPSHMPSTSRPPARSTPIATHTGRSATPEPRTSATIASISSTACTASRGRFCHAAMSATIPSVICRDRLPAHRGVTNLGQMIPGLPDGAPLRTQADHTPRQTVQTAAVLGHRGRLEGPGSVPGHRQAGLADLSGDPLGGRPVARVRRPVALGRVPLITEVLGHLGLETGLEHLAHQPGPTDRRRRPAPRPQREPGRPAARPSPSSPAHQQRRSPAQPARRDQPQT